MKKFLIVLVSLLLMGCSSELVCTKQENKETYDTITKEFFKFSGKKIVDAYSTQLMTFKSEAQTDSYFRIFEELSDSYEVIKKNELQIEVSVAKEYKIYNNDKEKIIEEFEDKGYICE